MTAFAGTYSDFKLVKTRGVAQVVIEIPLEQAQAFTTAHGYPDFKAEKWFGIAALDTQAKPEAIKSKTAGEKAVTRAVLLCKDPAFQTWCGSPDTEEGTIAALRFHCDIKSRSELATNEAARSKFEAIETSFKYRDQMR